MSMPFNFVNKLKDGKWENIITICLKHVNQTMKHAASNSINDVRLVCKIMPFDMTEQANKVDRYECYIYATTMNNKAKTQFYAGFSQISDIIGDEEWMKGDMNTIYNIASQRKVSLTWGAKKKSKKRSLFEVGDEVIVSNHGTKWDRKL